MPKVFEVRVIGVPVPLWVASRQHSDELMREFALVYETAESEPASVPARLTNLVQEVKERYGAISKSAQGVLAAAEEEGIASVDLAFEAPAELAGSARHLLELLEEADEYCRAGRHLLTLTSSPDVRAFREWYLGQFIDQIGGAEPTPWADFRSARQV
ncbi:MAG: hypothetical protein M0Z87_03665 [Actinomycetota bacterium]|nr:hypothetical protein [Actinomycetota bacterium]